MSGFCMHVKLKMLVSRCNTEVDRAALQESSGLRFSGGAGGVGPILTPGHDSTGLAQSCHQVDRPRSEGRVIPGSRQVRKSSRLFTPIVLEWDPPTATKYYFYTMLRRIFQTSSYCRITLSCAGAGRPTWPRFTLCVEVQLMRPIVPSAFSS